MAIDSLFGDCVMDSGMARPELMERCVEPRIRLPRNVPKRRV